MMTGGEGDSAYEELIGGGLGWFEPEHLVSGGQGNDVTARWRRRTWIWRFRAERRPRAPRKRLIPKGPGLGLVGFPYLGLFRVVIT